MPSGLFRDIIGQIADCGWKISGNHSLGLFEDALLDEFIVERCEYARRFLPSAPIAVNTNGAAYNRAKHLALREIVTAIALHVESYKPQVYTR